MLPLAALPVTLTPYPNPTPPRLADPQARPLGSLITGPRALGRLKKPCPEPPGVQRRGRQQGAHTRPRHVHSPAHAPPAPSALPAQAPSPPSWRAPRTPLRFLVRGGVPHRPRSHAAATPSTPPAVASYRFADPGAAALPAPDGRLAGRLLLGHRGRPEPAAAASAATPPSPPPSRYGGPGAPPARGRDRRPAGRGRVGVPGRPELLAPACIWLPPAMLSAGAGPRRTPLPHRKRAPRRAASAGPGCPLAGCRGRGWKPAARRGGAALGLGRWGRSRDSGGAEGS